MKNKLRRLVFPSALLVFWFVAAAPAGAQFIDAPVISSVLDVPNDDGRQVNVTWSRSALDTVAASPKITQYAIYRRIDPNLLTFRAPGDGEAIVVVGGQPQHFLPVGWHFVDTDTALEVDSYTFSVATLADSTINDGMYRSTFFVRARTATPGVFFDSAPDSGYSVDNLGPAPPQNFIKVKELGVGTNLTWDPAADGDWRFFNIYRDTDPAFVPSGANLVHQTIDTFWTDPGSGVADFEYKITGIDFSGNEGPAALAGAATVIPKLFNLSQNRPNPFRPSLEITEIPFEVPAGGGNVKIEIFDVGGRLVRSLINEQRPAGSDTVDWDGKNFNGKEVPSGVYFYRMNAPGFEGAKKIVVRQ